MDNFTQNFYQKKGKGIVNRLLGVFTLRIAVMLLLFGGISQVNAQTVLVGYDYTTGLTTNAWATPLTFNAGTAQQVTISLATNAQIKSATVCGTSNISHNELGSNSNYLEINLAASSSSSTLAVEFTGSANNTTANACKAGVVYSNKIPFSLAAGDLIGAESSAFLPVSTGAWTPLTLTVPAGTKSLRIYRQIYYNSTTKAAQTGSSTGFTQFGLGATIRMASIKVTVTSTGPAITGATTSTTAFTTTFGTASAAQTFTIGGTNLGTTDITATAPTGFEVSSDGTTYGSTATFAPTSGTVINGQLRVRLAANASVGLYNNNNIVLTSGSATSVNITTSSSGNEVFSLDPYISSNPTSVAFGYLKNNTSNIQSFNISAGNLTPASGDITVTAPTGYLVSTSNSSGFASSITVSYSSGTLASTPIYVKFTPTQSQSYSGTISISGGGATSSVSLTGTGSAFNDGSYKSVGTGNWTATSTWNKWNCVTSSWSASSDTPNLATSDVYISGGFTVTVDASAKNCGNIEVSESSALIANSIVKTPVYIRVNGNTVSVASGSRIGNSNTSDTADGISFDVYSNNLTITGGGLISISRIRTNTANTLLTIDTDVTLNYHGSGNAGNAAGYYTVAGNNNTLTINAGKTLTFAPWSSLLYTSGSHSTSSNLSQTINLYGTMTFVDGEPTPEPSPYVPSGWTGHHNYFSMNVNNAASSTLNVYNGGVLNVSEFYPNGTNSSNTPGQGNLVTINVETGGKINVSTIADFRNVLQTVTGGGEFNLLAGATMKIGATTGISASSAAGPIQTTIRGFNIGSTYSYEGTSAQVTGDGLPLTVNNLTINNSSGVTLSSTTNLTGMLTLSAGLFAAGNYLTLKSSSTSTARVAPVSGSISGNVTVERYIPAKRAWRALTAPVSTTGSIYTNWQEGGTANSTNGFDIWMPGGSNGLTAGGSSNSLLEYNSADNTWTGITATNGSSSMMNSTKNKPFMAFVTGPYGAGNITSNSAATTLRATGSLLTGDQSYTTTAGKYTFIGNPYASPLDLSVMMNTSQNATASFEGNVWVWDANASGLNAVGTYNLFNNGTYTNLTSNTAVVTGTQIQSGQAFFVKSTDGATFTIKESHKGTTFSNAVFRNNNPAQLLRVGLYKQENNEWSGRDGAMTVILPDANANQSPNKMANGTENVAFVKNGSLFASNHHLPLVASDVLNIRVWRTTAGANYKLKINTEQFTSTNLNATLEDLFTNSRTPLNLEGTAVEYPFTVTTDALSTGDRFRIVFQNAVLGTNSPTANSFSIVPNPVTGDSFQVNLGTLATGIYSYSICNAIGQEVEKGILNNVTQNTNYEVKMSNSATGIYIMKIKGNDNTVFTAKIIKK